MSLLEVALDHADHRRRLALAASGEARRLWMQVDPGRISESWAAKISRLLVVVSGAQQAAAGSADSYLNNILNAQGVSPVAEARLVASALSGVASDGRDLASLLYRPAVTSLVGIGSGATPARALAGGAATLDMIVRTQVADAGRAGDVVALTARRQVTGYVRMLSGKSCSRCAVLAGRRYAWNAGFRRHPRCPATARTFRHVRTRRTTHARTRRSTSRV